MMSKNIKIYYRTIPVVFATLVFAVSALWLLFEPRTSGKIGGLLPNGAWTSILIMLAAACAICLTAIFLLHALRAFLGLPAIECDHQLLKIYIFPFKKFPLQSVISIVLDEKWLIFRAEGGVEKRVNRRIIRDYEGKMKSLNDIVAKSRHV